MTVLTAIGIDPGVSGGIAWITASGDACAHPMPETERETLLLFDDIDLCSSRAVIERVHAIPGVGSTSSSFTFGRGYGFLRGLLTVFTDRFNLPWSDVPPQRWQAGLGLAKGMQGPERKRALRAIAHQRFPRAGVTMRTCDALLIAEWLRGQP